MGYQESYVTTKKASDFNKMVDYFKKTKLWSDPHDNVNLVSIITLDEEITGDYFYMCHPDITYKFSKGSKFLYFVGERYEQKCFIDLFDLDNRIATASEMKWIKDVQIIFTECFPSESIFGENGKKKIATHEEFKFE
jgi:hypothetical protein